MVESVEHNDETSGSLKVELVSINRLEAVSVTAGQKMMRNCTRLSYKCGLG